MGRLFLRQLAVCCVIFIFSHFFAFSQNFVDSDYVVYRTETSQDQPSVGADVVRLEGEIVNLTGRGGMTFRPNGGRETKIPLTKIVDFGTVKETSQVNAELAMQNGDFRGAVDGYLAARKSEKRDWVKRQQTSMLVQAYVALGEQDRACREFFTLAESDPETPYLACIPLPWYVDLSQSLAYQKLGEPWLNRPEYPACQLLSAGLSLTTDNRARAAEVLRVLAKSDNPSIAALATAQLWRLRLAEANASEALGWEKQLDAMPEDLRSGPHFLLGEVFARLGQTDNALIHWLHVPLDTPDMRPLARLCLQRAIETLDKNRRTAEAETLRLELQRFSDDKNP